MTSKDGRFFRGVLGRSALLLALFLALAPAALAQGGGLADGSAQGSGVWFNDKSGDKSGDKPGDRSPNEPDYHTYTRGPKGTDRVALSFDDGPHPALTPRLLDILSGRKVKATFFVLGDRVEKYPALARALTERGHEIANHGATHANLKKAPSELIRSELQRTQDSIEKVTRAKPTLFRPPYGATRREVFDRADAMGLTVVTWSVDPRDWERGKTADEVVKFIISNVEGGSIVLLHDIHSRTIDAVPRVIDGLRAKGFRFVTVGELIEDRKKERAREAAARAESGSEGYAPASSVVPLGRSSYKRYRKDTKTRS